MAPPPTQASDETYFYDFKGWDYEIARVCEDTTYTATYARHSLGLQFALTTNKKGYKVTKYSGSASSVEVGEVHNGLPVTEIGPSRSRFGPDRRKQTFADSRQYQSS